MYCSQTISKVHLFKFGAELGYYVQVLLNLVVKKIVY